MVRVANGRFTMRLKNVFTRGAAWVALAGLISTVHAGETGTHTTQIKLIGKDQKLETLSFEGELAAGESRGLYTDAGTAVTVRRTDQGLSIETPERTVNVPYPDASELAAGGDQNLVIAGDGTEKRIVIMHGDHEGTAQDASGLQHKRVIVIKNGADGNEDVDVDLRVGDPEALAALGDLHSDAAGSDHEQVIVIRKVKKEVSDTAANQ